MRIASCVILAGLSVLPALALTQVGDVLVATADLGADTGSIEIEERLVSRHEMRTSRRLIVVGASGEAAVRNLTDDPVSAGGPSNSSANLYRLSEHLYAVVSIADCTIVETTRPSIETCPRARTETSHDLRCVFRAEYPTWGLAPDPARRPEYIGRFD